MKGYLAAAIALLVVAGAVLVYAAQLYYDEMTPPYAITLLIGAYIPLYVQFTIGGILVAVAGASLLWWYRISENRIKNTEAIHR